MTKTRSVVREPAAHRLSGPGELLQAVPYLLGFRPADSLVLVGLAAERLVVTARLDLADVVPALAGTVAAMARGGARDVVAAVYDDRVTDADSRGALPRTDLAVLAAEQIEAGGCGLVDVLLVGAGRWWSYLCDVADCCPPAGTLLPNAPSPFAAAATVSGVVAFPDRAALAGQLDPVPGREGLLGQLQAAERAAARAVADGQGERRHRAEKRALFAEARRSQRPGWVLAHADAIRFGAGLRAAEVNRAVWLAVDAQRLDGRELWRMLARRMPAPYDAVPAFLFGWHSWRAGAGTLARIAAERAAASEPGYAAPQLLLAALSEGVNPRRLPRLRSAPPA